MRRVPCYKQFAEWRGVPDVTNRRETTGRYLSTGL
jgi:hypothetical protein